MDVNLWLNVITFAAVVLGAVVFGPRAFKAKQASADLLEKDRTIQTHEQSIAALETAAAIALREHMALQKRCDEAIEKARIKSEIAAGFQARYEEVQKYTAKEALRTLEKVIGEQGVEAERRHVEVLRMLDGMSELLGERREAYRADPPDPPDRP